MRIRCHCIISYDFCYHFQLLQVGLDLVIADLAKFIINRVTKWDNYYKSVHENYYLQVCAERKPNQFFFLRML